MTSGLTPSGVSHRAIARPTHHPAYEPAPTDTRMINGNMSGFFAFDDQGYETTKPSQAPAKQVMKNTNRLRKWTN